MIRWPLSRIASAVGGGPSAADLGAHAAGVSIDARTITPGTVFIAIQGENFDGHDFIPDAIRAGAVAVIAKHDTDAPAIVVADTRRALADLARAYRRSLAGKVVGVTGSVGKTSTCRMLDSILSAGLRGTASIKSFNNSIGVPLTILGAGESDDYLICEMGTSSPGEIAALSEIVSPDIAVITSIGRSHLELLGDLDGVRREKATIAASVSADGIALVPSADVELGAFLPNGVRVETVGVDDGADHRVLVCDIDQDGTRFELAGEEFFVPFVGEHHAVNAAFAVVVAQRLGLDTGTIHRGLSHAVPAAMRFETHEIGGVTIVNDAYNANPESMAASLRAFAAAHAEAERRVVVIGDMLELGSHSHAAHAEMAGFVAALGFDVVVAVGPESIAALSDVATIAIGSLDRGAELVLKLFLPGDAVLLKGSRGMGLERVLDACSAAQTTEAGA